MVITTTNSALNPIGNQPPSKNFKLFDVKNTKSIKIKKIPPNITRKGFQRQILIATDIAKKSVNSIVPVTAIP